MLPSSFISLALLTGVAWTQTPPYFSPSTNWSLPATFDENTTTTSTSFFVLGGVFSEDATQAQPTVYLPANRTTDFASGTEPATFILLMVDPDAPSPSNTSLSSVLHLLQPNMRESRSVETTTTANGTALAMLTNSSAPLQPYAGPAPLSSAPHRYILLLFRQPNASAFAMPSAFAAFTNGSQRTGFDLASFVDAAGLDDPVAANYFLCGNDTAGNGSQTYTGSDAAAGIGSSTASPSASAASSTAAASGGSAASSAASAAGAASTGSGAERKERLGLGALMGAVGAAVWMLG